ncbi:MAG: hypothetical protein ACRDPG_00990 [Nocardioidaceae bacterium]
MSPASAAMPTLAPFARLVDDAAIFPPGSLPMAQAVPAHARHRATWYADLVGPLVCSDDRLADLQRELDAVDPAAPLSVSVTVSGGAGAIEPAIVWVTRDERLHLGGVEVALRDEDDLRRNAARMATVLEETLPDDAIAFIEMPRLYADSVPHGWGAALDEVAAGGYSAKFRTGGAAPDEFPSPAELATVIAACLDREVAFKCTAGLHHAVRHAAPVTGFEHHGFLNVLLATRVSLDGADVGDVADLLANSDSAEVVSRCRDVGPDGLARARRWFCSFGSCSVDEPVGDLVALGLLADGQE